MKRNQKLTVDKSVHALAVKLRKMSDSELVAKFYASYQSGYEDAVKGKKRA